MTTIRRLFCASAIGAVFAAGYLCGAVMQPEPAVAQVGDLMKKASELGASDPLGSAAKLGTTITEMQKNVDGLNQNLEVLNQIKTALGG